MALSNTDETQNDFWLEYEEKTGEKVTARCLGQYVSGWEEFGNLTSIWGLVIFTSGGFRFHHFPQQNWLESMIRTTGGKKSPKEKTIFVPKEKIKSIRIIEELKWWKKIFSSRWPMLIIRYLDETESERQLLLEADLKSGKLKSDDLLKAISEYENLSCSEKA